MMPRVQLIAALIWGITSSLAFAEENSLLIPIKGNCGLNIASETQASSLARCTQLAEQGDAQTAYELGSFYLGSDTSTSHNSANLDQALAWFKKASMQGHAGAQYQLGQMFYQGKGVPQNDVQAFIFLKMAAVNGSDDALDAIDLLYPKLSAEQISLASQIIGDVLREYLVKMQNNNLQET